MGIYELLDGNDDFNLRMSGHDVTVRRASPEQWIVYINPGLDYIGRFTMEQRDNATYYASEVAGEPNVTEWVSDDPLTLISRMLTLRN
jgi:hypothetical protein